MKTDEIIKQRLHLWKTNCINNNATPQILISVGIEGKEYGKVFVQITEDIEVEQIRSLLIGILKSI